MQDKPNAIETQALSPELNAALLATLEKIKADLVGLPDHYYDDRPVIEPVSSVGYEGFAPYTNGGYDLEVRGMISLAAERGKGPAPAQWLIDQYIEEVDEADQDADDYDEAALREVYDGFYRYQVRALIFLKDNDRNITGADELYLWAGINPYEPGEHGSHAHLVYETTLPLADLTADKIDAAGGEIMASFDFQFTPEGLAVFQAVEADRKAAKRAEQEAAQAYWSKQGVG